MLDGVERQLALDRRFQVDAAVVGDLQQVEQHVRQLLAEVLALASLSCATAPA
jgi:hypothetical protein